MPVLARFYSIVIRMYFLGRSTILRISMPFKGRTQPPLTSDLVKK